MEKYIENKQYEEGDFFIVDDKIIKAVAYSDCGNCVFNKLSECGNALCFSPSIQFTHVSNIPKPETLKENLDSLKVQNSTLEKENLIMKIMVLGSDYTVAHTKSLQEATNESIKLLDSYIEALNK